MPSDSTAPAGCRYPHTGTHRWADQNMTWLDHWQHFHRPSNLTVHAPLLQNQTPTYQEVVEPKLCVHIVAKESMQDRKQVTHILIPEPSPPEHHINYTFRNDRRSIEGENSPIFSPLQQFFVGILTLGCERPLGWSLCPAAVRSRPASSRRHQPHSSAMS